MSDRQKTSCPCTWGTPCHSNCSCAEPAMSGGCQCCVRYGNPQQKQAHAEHIIADLARLRDIERAARVLLMLCHSTGEPCDGFRFREIVRELRVLMGQDERGQSVAEHCAALAKAGREGT